MLKSFGLLFAFAWASTASAEMVEIFSLPLGGKLATKMQKCSTHKKEAAKICWLGKPFDAGGGVLLASAAIRDDLLPKWATAEFPQVQINDGKFLHSIKYASSTSMYRDREEIVSSISRRFGQPSVINYQGTYSATWVKLPGRIELGCYRGSCYLDILSDVAERERVELKEKRDLERQRRPQTL